MKNSLREWRRSLDLSKLKRFFTHDWQTKLISLLLAMGFWFYVTYFENKTDYNLSIPIRFENLPNDQIIVYSSLKNAFITLPLRRDQKQTVDFNKAIRARVDLSNALEGSSNYDIELIYDKELKIKPHLKQDKVNIIIDKKIIKTLPIKEKMIGTPSEGYYLEEVSLEEKTCVLSGPAQKIDLLNFIETAPIDITGLSNSQTLKVKIENPENTQLLRKQQISVRLKIREMQVEKEIDFPVEVLNLPEDLKISQEPKLKIRINTTGRYLKNLKNSVRLSVDGDAINEPGTYNLKIDIDHPDTIKIIKVPGTVKIQVLEK